MANLRELAGPAEGLIDAYRNGRSVQTWAHAWRGLVLFWAAAGDAPEDEDGDPAEDGAHYSLCFRLVSAMEHVGFDPESDEGEDYLRTAALDVLQHLNEGYEEQDVLGGKDSLLEDGTELTVDLLDGKVYAGTSAPDRTIRREAPKIGRNDPCPCGSGKKYKKCSLLDRCAKVEA